MKIWYIARCGFYYHFLHTCNSKILNDPLNFREYFRNFVVINVCKFALFQGVHCPYLKRAMAAINIIILLLMTAVHLTFIIFTFIIVTAQPSKLNYRFHIVNVYWIGLLWDRIWERCKAYHHLHCIPGVGHVINCSRHASSSTSNACVVDVCSRSLVVLEMYLVL